MTTLSDLGERRILREIIPRYVAGAGDDCAVLELGRKYTVITTDPVPRPAAEILGGDDDPFWLGWLLVTINASDIAASGARPEAFVAHLDLPNDYDLGRFERLLQGISASCAANGLRYVGGNLREAKVTSAVGSAVGSSDIVPLVRRGGVVGDDVVVVGVSGQFWLDAFTVQNGGTVAKEASPLFRPISQALVMYKFHEAGLISAAMDTSDGLAPTLEELALINGVLIDIDVRALSDTSEAPNSDGLSRQRLSFGFGDWTVVCIVPHDRMQELSNLANQIGASVRSIGRLRAGPPSVFLVDGQKRKRAGRLESERFAADSWFTKGIGEYMAMLRAFPMP